jgi:DNA replication regulator SLD3
LPNLNGSSQPLISKYLIPRSFLPLAYLDPVADGEGASGSRLFAAHIDSLEKEGDESLSTQPLVLLAQSKDCGRFYAVERVRTGLYAVCRLGQWVAENALKDLAQRVLAQIPCQPQKTPREVQNNSAKEWWRTAVAPAHDFSHVSSLNPDAITRARDFKLSLERPSRRHLSPVPVSVAASPGAAENFVSIQTDAIHNGIQKTENSLKIIKTHYQDALYLSRAPLAYFAKGPLSRARASFQYDEGSGNNYLKLTQYLRTMILDLQVMDKKYRETLPVLIECFPFTPLSDGEG